MAIESDGHSRGNPRIYELIENAPKVGKSPTIWAWPEVVDWLRIAGQPVPGPWPPHQTRRPDPTEESLPVAVAEPERPQDQAPPTSGGREWSARTEDQAPPAPPARGGREWPAGPEDDNPRRGVGWQDS
jgi:hypothetical protein